MKQFLLILDQFVKQINRELMQKLLSMMTHKFHFRIELELILKECDEKNFIYHFL